MVVQGTAEGTCYYIPANQPQHTELLLAARTLIGVYMLGLDLSDAVRVLEAAAGLGQQEGT